MTCWFTASLWKLHRIHVCKLFLREANACGCAEERPGAFSRLTSPETYSTVIRHESRPVALSKTHTHTHSRVARSCKQTQQWQQQQDMAAAPLVPPWWSPCPSLTRTSLWHRGAHQLGKSGHLTPVRSHCQEGTFQPLLKRRLRAVPFVEQQIQHHVIKPQHLQEPVMVWQDRLGFWQIMTVNARHERHMCSN